MACDENILYSDSQTGPKLMLDYKQNGIPNRLVTISHLCLSDYNVLVQASQGGSVDNELSKVIWI